MRAEQILEQVDDEQRAAVVADAGPLLVVAGAGTGKTRTLTCRVAFRVATGEVPAGGVLAVTHSTRAAGEMRDRFRRFGVDGLERVAARTVHAAALSQLRYFWAATGRSGELTVADDQYAVMRAGLRSLGLRNVDGALVTDLLSEVQWAKTQLVPPDRYATEADRTSRVTAVDYAKVTAAYAAYEARLHEVSALDFTDLLTEAARLIETEPAVAEEIRRRYRSLCVDEYQDVDPAQQRLIDAWLGDGRDLTVVGDPRQSIYAFKGADPQLLTTFPARYSGAHVVALTRNYRSTPQVVAVANHLAAAADPTPEPKPRAAKARAQWLAAHPAPLTGMRPGGPTATVRELGDEAAEAKWVAAQIGAAVRGGTPLQEIAILYRFNAQAAPFEQALTAAGIPYRVTDGDRFFDRVEIATVLHEMRRRVEIATYGASTAAPIHFDDDGEPIGWDSDGHDGGDLRALSGPALLREVLADDGWDRSTPPNGVGVARDRWESRLALIELVEQTPDAERVDAGALLLDLEARRAEAHQVTTRSVTLATMHKAKGLEWDLVFCPRWTEGSLPISFAQTGPAIEEERRLAYVAVTRARHALVVSHARTRLFGKGQDAKPRPVKASRFLSDAGFVATDGATSSLAPAKGRASRRPSGPGTRCGKCAVPLEDESLVTLGFCALHLSGEPGRRWVMLREWRSDMARLDAVPAYRILPDASLLALVATAPTTMDGLRSIKGIGPSKLSRYGSELLGVLHRPAA